MTHVTAPRTAAAEPALLEVPAPVLELLGLPALERLRDDQVRGRDCVWCGTGPLTVATSVDLGEQRSPLASSSSVTGMTWFPRACHRCTSRRALRALHEHTPGCAECHAQAPGCEVGHALTRLTIREARR